MEIQPDALRKDLVGIITQVNAELEPLIQSKGTLTETPEDKMIRASLLQAKASAYNGLVMLQTPRDSRLQGRPPGRTR